MFAIIKLARNFFSTVCMSCLMFYMIKSNMLKEPLILTCTRKSKKRKEEQTVLLF